MEENKMRKLFTLFAAFVLVVAFTVPAMAAADWNFFGSARMTTFVEIDDPPEPADSDTDTTWTLQGNSRFGANVKAGDIGGGLEIGIKGDADGNGLYTRKLFGTYTFGDSQILVGQTYTPVSGMFYSNQVWGGDNDLLNCGQAYAGRRPMLRYKINGFQVALVQPNAGAVGSLPAGGDTDVLLPKFEMKYHMKQETFFMDIYAGAQTFSVEYKGTNNDTDYDVTSYVAGIGGGADFGPAFVKANVYYAVNGGTFGLAALGKDDPYYDATTDDIIDVDTLGAMGVVGVKAGDTATIEAGVGYIQNEYDVDDSNKDDAMSVYLNCTINIAPGFFVVPEVGYFDYGKDHADQDEGKMTYVGAKWQINF